jgi:hypothetical protein
MIIPETLYLECHWKIFEREVGATDWNLLEDGSNLITNLGFQLIGSMLVSNGTDYLKYMGWTAGSTAANAADTTLETESTTGSGQAGEQRLSVLEYAYASKVQTIRFWMGAAQGNTPGTINKIGTFTALTGGTLIQEYKFGSSITKNSSKELLFECSIEMS